jgi:hypothetical protein
MTHSGPLWAFDLEERLCVMGDRESAYWQAIAELAAALTALLEWATEASLRRVPDAQITDQLCAGIRYARDAALRARDWA